MAYNYDLIVWAAPIFTLLMAVEYLWGKRIGRQTYRLSDAMASINLGVLSQVSGVVSKAFGLADERQDLRVKVDVELEILEVPDEQGGL